MRSSSATKPTFAAAVRHRQGSVDGGERFGKLSESGQTLGSARQEFRVAYCPTGSLARIERAAQTDRTRPNSPRLISNFLPNSALKFPQRGALRLVARSVNVATACPAARRSPVMSATDTPHSEGPSQSVGLCPVALWPVRGSPGLGYTLSA